MLLWSIASERRMSQSFPHTKFVWSAVKCTIEFNWLRKKAEKYLWPITERVFGKNTGDVTFDFLFIPNFHISIFSEMSPPNPGIYFLFSLSEQCRRSLCWRHCLHTYIRNWPLPNGAFQGQWNTTKQQNRTLTKTVKNPNWPEANQLAIYKCS